MPTSSSSSRRAVASGASSATSRLPAGISRRRPSTAARYWRTMSTEAPSSTTGTIDTAPGWWTSSRSNSSPSGSAKVPTPTEIRWPPKTSRSASLRNGVKLQQARTPALGPGQSGAHQLPEQGVGAVGPALELGMGLSADPERVAFELDELHQAVVGRGTGAAQARLLETGPVAGVELVAVAVTLVDDRLPVGGCHLRSGLELGRVD